jgi:glycosyltransferase involved in cell wall biosynthesis
VLARGSCCAAMGGHSDMAASAVGGKRILIDALAARFGGTAYATVQLARQLAARPEVAHIFVVTRRGSIVYRGLNGDRSVTCVALREAQRLELTRRLCWEMSRLPTLVSREHVGTVISLSGTLPRSPGSRVICLVSNPVMYESGGAANALRRTALRHFARRASYLAAPTRNMAELVEASTGRECGVAPWGVDHTVFAPAARAGDDILCVADFYAHKRHDLIVDAWLLLPTPRPRLRFIGNDTVDPATYARLLARVNALQERSSIVIEHALPLERLVNAYQRARVFVMASEHESFCMPLVESMSCGVPVVARGLQSLRETAGDGGSYVDGNDPARWAASIARLIADNDEHAHARRAAVRSASRFSWSALGAQIATRL